MREPQKIKVITDKYDDTLIFSEYTGEIIKIIKNDKPKKKVNPVDKYIGVDVRYPKDCLTEDQLIETLSVLDAYVKDKPKINTRYLVESLAAGYITPQQQTFLFNLCENITGWNIFIGTREQLYTFGVDSKSLKRVLSSLSPEYLQVVSENTPYKGCVIIQVNPLVGWKGDNRIREQKRLDWYGVNTDNSV